MYQFHKLHSSLSRHGDNLLQEKFDFGLSQFMILKAAGYSPNTSQCKVARFLNVTEAAVSRQIDSLVGRGLLTKIPNAENRREHVLELTEEGRERLAEAKVALEAVYKDLFSVLTHDEQSRLRMILGKLQKSVCPVQMESNSTKEGK